MQENVEKKPEAGEKETEQKQKDDRFKQFSWKEVVFFLVAGVLLVYDGYLWKQVLVDEAVSGPVSYILPIAVMVAFAITFGISSLLATKKLFAIPIIFVASFGVIGFVPLWRGSFVAIALVFLALLSFHSLLPS